jgi:hypothetical protein
MDVLETSRVEQELSRGEWLLADGVFTPEEITYCSATGKPAQASNSGQASATGAAIASSLQAKGITLSQSARQGALPPEDLARSVGKMTVLVSCWD